MTEQHARMAADGVTGQSGRSSDIIAMPVGDEILRASACGDHRQVARLINASPIEAWYAIPPGQLTAVMREIPPAAARSATLRAFRLFLNSDAAEELSAPTGKDEGAMGELAAKIFGARLRGLARQSSKLAMRTATLIQSANVLFDDTRGWRIFFNVQRGITGMLAGDFTEALDAFGDARHSPPHPTMTVLYRDAYVKSALVHALFGDPRLARNELAIAASLPMTTSWAEVTVSAHARIAEAVLCADDEVEASIVALERMPMMNVGELWPFWLEAMLHLHFRAGTAATGVERMLAIAALTPSEAEGYAGTVVPRLESLRALVRGDVARAMQELSAGPTDRLITELTQATLESAGGDWDSCIARTVRVRPRSRRLPRLETYRVITLASAVLRGGDADRAGTMLAELVAQHDAIGDRLIVVPTDLHEFAMAEVAGWPQRVPKLGTAAAAVPRLTARELEVLSLMATDQTREEIAAALFVSVNTVKSQQRSLSRKLGVTGRSQVLLEAERWGLLE